MKVVCFVVMIQMSLPLTLTRTQVSCSCATVVDSDDELNVTKYIFYTNKAHIRSISLSHCV